MRVEQLLIFPMIDSDVSTKSIQTACTNATIYAKVPQLPRQTWRFLQPEEEGDMQVAEVAHDRWN